MRILKFLLVLFCSIPLIAQIPAPQINLTGNIGCQGFPCVNNGTLIFSSDADRTMTAQESSAFYIKVTSSVPLTATRNLIAPSGRFPFTIENATTGGQSIQIIGTSGTGITIANGTTSGVWNDGTNYVATSTSTAATAWSAITSGSNTQTGAFSTAGQWTFSNSPGTASGAAGTYFSGTPETSSLYNPVVLIGSGTAPSYTSNGSMEVINAPSGFSGAGYLLSGYSNGTQAFYIEGNGTTYFANSLSSNGTMSSNNGYKTASTSLIGFGSGSYNSTADTILCRGGSAGVVSVESASTCTNTIGGATGTLAATSITATTFTGTLVGGASLDLPLTGGTLTGSLTGTSVTATSFIGALTGTVNGATIGYSSTYSNISLGCSLSSATGGYETAVGVGALCNDTTGSYNTAEGYQALSVNTTGGGNTAVGFQALVANTTGASNTAVGYAPLYSNTTGSYNTAEGYQALLSNTTGNVNTAVGYLALAANTTGTENTAVGFQALYSSTGSGNTAVGYQALNNATGSNNTALGSLAEPAANSDTNEIVIGYNALGNGSNTVTLGNTSIIGTYLEGTLYQNGTAVTINRDVIHASYVGTPLASSQIFGYYVPDSEQTVTVPASCTNSRAVAATAATASTTLTIYKCTTAFSASCSSVGTIVFAASGTVGTWTCSSSFALTGSSSNGLYIQGPSTADTTLGNIAIALYGTHN